jgi:hypothetical protein
MKTRQRARGENLSFIFSSSKASFKASHTEVMTDLQEVLGYKPPVLKNAQVSPRNHSSQVKKSKRPTRVNSPPIDPEYEAILGLASLMSELDAGQKPKAKILPRQSEAPITRNTPQPQPQPQPQVRPNFAGFPGSMPMYPMQSPNQFYLPTGLPFHGASLLAQSLQMYFGRFPPMCMPMNTARQKVSRTPPSKFKRGATHVAIAYYISKNK